MSCQPQARRGSVAERPLPVTLAFGAMYVLHVGTAGKHGGLEAARSVDELKESARVQSVELRKAQEGTWRKAILNHNVKAFASQLAFPDLRTRWVYDGDRSGRTSSAARSCYLNYLSQPLREIEHSEIDLLSGDTNLVSWLQFSSTVSLMNAGCAMQAKFAVYIQCVLYRRLCWRSMATSSSSSAVVRRFAVVKLVFRFIDKRLHQATLAWPSSDDHCKQFLVAWSKRYEIGMKRLEKRRADPKRRKQ